MKRLRITVGDRTYEVMVEVLSDETPYQGPAAASPQHERPGTPPAGSNPVVPPAAASAKPSAAAVEGAITSPMPGVVKSILVKAGESVQNGQPLVILDAMKMENKVTASTSGSVKSIEVTKGESVQEGQVLVLLEA